MEHIRAGRAGIDEVAAYYGVAAAEVRHWLALHAEDRTLHLGEFRRGLGGESGRLARQAQRLRRLIARTDRTLQFLHARLLSRRLAPTSSGIQIPYS